MDDSSDVEGDMNLEVFDCMEVYFSNRNSNSVISDMPLVTDRPYWFGSPFIILNILYSRFIRAHKSAMSPFKH